MRAKVCRVEPGIASGMAKIIHPPGGAAHPTGCGLALFAEIPILRGMAMPQTPVTLSPEQVSELNEKLSITRHDINNNLSLMVAAIELMRRKPEMAPRMMDRIAEQPDRIIAQMRGFSAEFEKTLGITKD